MHRYIIWFEILAFLCSLVALPVIRKSRYLRIYPVLLAIILSVEGYYQFIVVKTVPNAPLYNIQVPLQYLCYILILYYSAKSRRIRNFLVAGFIVIVAGNLVTDIFFTPKMNNNVWGYSICSFVAICGIVLKLYEMSTASSLAKYDFLKDPFFYLLFAFLYYNLVTLPYFVMSNWLFYTNSYKKYSSMYLTLRNVMSISNYVLYTTYSTAFIWIARRQVIY